MEGTAVSTDNLPAPVHGEITPGRPLLVVAMAGEATHLSEDVDNVPVLITGIGRIRTTLALTDCLHRYLRAGGLPSGIINMGTAGALRPGLTGVHRIDRVLLHDFSHSSIAAITGRDEYPPIDLRSEYSTGERGEHISPDTLDGIDRDAASHLTLATGDVYVESDTLRDRLAEDADLVDMEGYAVASVARWFGVPVQLIKIIDEAAQNAAGTGSTEATSGNPLRRSWRGELPRSARELAAQVRRELTN